MSYIQLHVKNTDNGPSDILEIWIDPGSADRTFETDSESLLAAAAIIQAVEDLEEGEALVVRKEIY